MKRLWFVLLIILIVSGICVLEVITTNKFVSSIQGEIDKAIEFVNKDDIEQAKKYSNYSLDKWNEYKNAAAIFMIHNKIEEIGSTLTLVNRNILEEKKEEFLVEADKVLLQLDYIKSSEIPYWENIL